MKGLDDDPPLGSRGMWESVRRARTYCLLEVDILGHLRCVVEGGGGKDGFDLGSPQVP